MFGRKSLNTFPETQLCHWEAQNGEVIRQRKSRLIQCAQHSVHPTGGSRRVFRQVVWLEVGSVKVASSRPTHQRVTPAVRCI